MNDNIFSTEQLDRLKDAMAKVMEMPGTGLDGAENGQAAERNDAAWDSMGTNLAKGTYLRVEEDEMSAWLYLAPPDHGQAYSKAELETFLQKKGVTHGYHSSNLSAMVKKKVYDREILVAQGVLCQEGQEGWFEYLFSPEEYRVPKIRADGSVDYASMNALQNVRKGEKVAIYHYAVQGVNGFTVTGTELKAKPVRDLPPMHGKGILRENESYYAQSDGKIEVKDGKIDIQNVHQISGDVDAIIGKVEFFGDVIISGNVESGVVIRAGRNIEVHGTTGGAALYAGGDVILTRGIQGGSKISARGNVFADFIENTTVECGGTVQANSILNSNVMAKDKVITTGRRGAIIGGYTHGLKGIEAICAGNDAEIKTILHCGYEAQTYERLLEIRRRQEEIRASLAKLVETMTEALRTKKVRGANGNVTAESKLAEWNKLKDEYFAQLDKCGREQESLEEIIEKSKGAYIRVDGNLYRNVVISINADQMLMERSTCYMRYAADQGVIEGTVIVHN